MCVESWNGQPSHSQGCQRGLGGREEMHTRSVLCIYLNRWLSKPNPNSQLRGAPESYLGAESADYSRDGETVFVYLFMLLLSVFSWKKDRTIGLTWRFDLIWYVHIFMKRLGYFITKMTLIWSCSPRFIQGNLKNSNITCNRDSQSVCERCPWLLVTQGHPWLYCRLLITMRLHEH